MREKTAIIISAATVIGLLLLLFLLAE